MTAPQPALDKVFVDFSIKKLRQLAERIKDCLGRLNEEQVWARGSENENAVGNLALHLSGNVRQWIVSGIGGKPDIRVRDREFSARGDITPAELIERLDGVIDEAIAVVQRLNGERLLDKVKVQNYEVTVLEAVAHVVEHFAGHTGQIIYATKLATGSDLGHYKHLSQPKAHTEKTP
ncbi:MAG: DUF1572 family protein [Bryobacteraceae bacterium]